MVSLRYLPSFGDRSIAPNAMTPLEFELVVEKATRPYRSSGRYAWYFARGKLRHDPLFRSITRRVLPRQEGKILDLGCGQGLLFAWLAAAGERPARGADGWHGMELSPGRVKIARRALDGLARIDCCDIRTSDFPSASVIAVFDVLQYMSAEDQYRVLEKSARALEPGGTLLLREADAGAGLRFRVTQWAERIVGAARGELRQNLHHRAVREWSAVLDQLGITVTTQPMSEGTPFANILYVGRKR